MSNIILMNKSYMDDEALSTVIKYCANPYKCIGYFAAGVDATSPETIIAGMKYTKEYLEKEEGRQLCHFIITVDSTHFKRDKLIEFCNEISGLTCIYWNRLGYQISSFVHTNTKKVHAHFVVNTVNILTGNMLSDATKILYKMHGDLHEAHEKLCWVGVVFNNGKEDDIDHLDE